MPDELSPGFWIPFALVLWGWIALDAAARRHRRRRMSAHFDRAMADWRECRAEYELALYAAYERAAEATNDRLLTAAAFRRGIDPLSLFLGPERRAYAHASPELKEHWESHPRVTFERFEAQWIANRQESYA